MMTMRPRIALWTDGSVWPTNPGPHGGWGAILVWNGQYRAMSGYFENATNQRAEALAVLHGLQVLRVPCDVMVYTDSQYVCKCMVRTGHKKLPEANQDIWKDFIPLQQMHSVQTTWVKGHVGIDKNEWANTLANDAATKQQGTDGNYEAIPEAFKGLIEKREARRKKRAERSQKKPV